MIEDAIARTGRAGKRVYSDDMHHDLAEERLQSPGADNHHKCDHPPTLIAVPEQTHPGESASNGLAERGVMTLTDQTKTFHRALHARIKIQFRPSNRSSTGSSNMHAFMLNKHLLGPDGKTPYGRLHGKEARPKLCEIGKKGVVVRT